jgi:hypothetical protein
MRNLSTGESLFVQAVIIKAVAVLDSMNTPSKGKETHQCGVDFNLSQPADGQDHDMLDDDAVQLSLN